ncbi:MAG: SHOCT domain-containing protein [Nitrospiraceae bacterium]|nr:SHOCT domain-containing protein [Nitrospiraceae bacterium]
MKTLSWVSYIAGFFSYAAVAEAQSQTQGYGPWPGMMGWGCGMGWPWSMMFIFWIVVIAGIVYFVRSTAVGKGRGSEESALEILKKRYAKGEISKDEYEKIKKDIS